MHLPSCQPAHRTVSGTAIIAFPGKLLLLLSNAQVQEDIMSSLCMRNPLRLTASFNRPNISYEARRAHLLICACRLHATAVCVDMF